MNARRRYSGIPGHKANGSHDFADQDDSQAPQTTLQGNEPAQIIKPIMRMDKVETNRNDITHIFTLKTILVKKEILEILK